jgi:hypothetical protein
MFLAQKVDEAVDWIRMIQEKGQWRAVVNTALKYISFWKGLCCMKLIS